MLKFRRITECEDEAAYMQKRFKQDICPQEKRFTAIPSVVLKSDFSSLNASYLNLPTPGGIQKKADELVSKTDNVKADSVPIVQTPSGFEEMNINEIGTDSYDIYRDIIKHSLTLPSEPGLDEAIRLVHTIGPEETIGAELWAKEPFSPIISPTELLKVYLFIFT